MSTRTLETLDNLVGALERKGVPHPSRYWMAEARRFYLHPSARILIECVGRGGDKSRFSVLMSIAETMACEDMPPPGEVHYFVHVSENLGEANKTVAILTRYLELLAIPFDRAAETFTLRGRPLGWKVLAARVGAVSGPRCYGWTVDECAKLPSEGVDPSGEIVASVKAMTVTHPHARGRLFSSPMGKAGFFYETWSLGDTSYQIAGHAPSWVANDSITEAACIDLEPHAPTRDREYGAIPSDAAGYGAFPAEHVNAICLPNAGSCFAEVGICDPAEGQAGSDLFAYGSACIFWETCGEPAQFDDDYDRETGQPRRNPKWTDPVKRVLLRDVGAFDQGYAVGPSAIDFDVVCDRLAAQWKANGITTAYGDQALAGPMASAMAKRGITYAGLAWGQQNKLDAAKVLRRVLREKALRVDDASELALMKRDLLQFREKVTDKGTLVLQAKRSHGSHADRGSLALLCARISAEGLLPGDVFRPPQGVESWSPYADFNPST